MYLRTCSTHLLASNLLLSSKEENGLANLFQLAYLFVSWKVHAAKDIKDRIILLQTMGLHTSANTNATQAASRANQPAAQSPVVVARRLDNEVGTIYVQCTKNNTICTLVDARGMPVAWTSAGSLGYKNSKKKNVQVSQHVAEDLTEKCLQKGFRTVRSVKMVSKAKLLYRFPIHRQLNVCTFYYWAVA